MLPKIEKSCRLIVCSYSSINIFFILLIRELMNLLPFPAGLLVVLPLILL
jgi:hypothetical protein